MDLADPTRKMSKSATSESGVVRLLDSPDVVRRKVARAVTDSETGADAVAPAIPCEKHHLRADPVLLAPNQPDVRRTSQSLLTETPGPRPSRPPDAQPGPCRARRSVAKPGAPTYGALERLVTDVVVDALSPVHLLYSELTRPPEHVDNVFATGAQRCHEETAPVLEAARAAMGLT